MTDEPDTMQPAADDANVQRVARELALAMYGVTPDPIGKALDSNPGGLAFGCDEDQYALLITTARNLVAQYGPMALMFTPEATLGRYDHIHIVFADQTDKGSGAPVLQFVEVETPDGKSIQVGEWAEKTPFNPETGEKGRIHLVIPYIAAGVLADISNETYMALKQHGATSEYLATIGSLCDTLPAEDVRDQLREANARPAGPTGVKGLFDLIPAGWFLESARENRTRVVNAGDKHNVFDNDDPESRNPKNKRFTVRLQHDDGGRLREAHGPTIAAALHAAVRLVLDHE